MIEELSQAILEGDTYDIAETLEKNLNAGAEPMACLEAMMAGLEKTGKLFERGDYFLPELIMAAETFKTGMEVLTPRLAGENRQFKGTVILGTVQGDVHDIGKNLVGFMLESAGFEVIDLGVDVPAERFVEAVKTHSAGVVALSALLTTTMLGMQSVIEALEKAGLRPGVKVLVGGAPLSKKFSEDIGADAYGSVAPQAVDIIKDWLAAGPG
jgi:5-methyltetrahydrofolate--homocysteine methyltransferase